MSNDIPLSKGHWMFSDFTQRMPVSDWRRVLLAGADTIVFRGDVVRLVAKSLGYGIVEVSKPNAAGGKEEKE